MKIEAAAARTNFFPQGHQETGELAGLPACTGVAPTGWVPREPVAEFAIEFLPISEKIVLEAITKANRAIQGANTRLDFSIHERTGQIMVKVRNSESGEIIREIPPEKILDLVANIWDMLGIFVDKKV